MSSALNFATFSGTEDPLALLPRSSVREYRKNDTIYAAQDRPEALYLVIDGRVKVSRIAEGGKEVVVDFYHKDDFFGETGLWGPEKTGEQATALDKTSVMMWSAAEVHRLATRTPALGLAMLRVLATKLTDANKRIESFCLDPIHRRLVKTLLHLARRLGEPSEGEMLHLGPTTHEQLARYVGTSREIVTQYMNQFRREQMLRYSRKGVELDVGALEKYLAAAA